MSFADKSTTRREFVKGVALSATGAAIAGSGKKRKKIGDVRAERA